MERFHTVAVRRIPRHRGRTLVLLWVQSKEIKSGGGRVVALVPEKISLVCVKRRSESVVIETVVLADGAGDDASW